MMSSWMRRCRVVCHAAGLVLLGCLAPPGAGGATIMPGEGHEAGVPPGFPTAHSAAPVARPLYVGLVFGGGSLNGGDYDGFGTLGLSLGRYLRPRVRIDGTVMTDGLGFKPQGTLGQAFTEAGAADVGLDVTVRYDLTKSLHLLAGVGAGSMFWNYTKPVTVIEDGTPRAVGYDGIFYGSFYGGAGMTLLRTRDVTVGGSLTGGARVYAGSMGSGLKNDLLKSTGFTRILLEVNYRVH
jgi:hypothetical protein